MRESEFRQALNAALAYGRPNAPAVADPQGTSVALVLDLLREALAQSGSEVGSWVHPPLRAAMDAGDPWRAATIVHAIGWLGVVEVVGWGHAIAREARQHRDLSVRRAGTRCLLRWRDATAVGILRGAFEPDPVLAGEIVSALDVLDPGNVPPAHDRRPHAVVRRAAWEDRMNRRHGRKERWRS